MRGLLCLSKYLRIKALPCDHFQVGRTCVWCEPYLEVRCVCVCVLVGNTLHSVPTPWFPIHLHKSGISSWVKNIVVFYAIAIAFETFTTSYLHCELSKEEIVCQEWKS